MSYKYTIKSLKKINNLFIICCIYMYFSEYLSLKYYCIFFFYKVTDFTIKKSSRP